MALTPVCLRESRELAAAHMPKVTSQPHNAQKPLDRSPRRWGDVGGRWRGSWPPLLADLYCRQRATGEGGASLEAPCHESPQTHSSLSLSPSESQVSPFTSGHGQ